MSLLDDNLEQQLFDVVHKDIINGLIRAFDFDHKMRIVVDSETIVDTIDWDEYKTDQILQVARKDEYPYGKQASDVVFLSNVELIQSTGMSYDQNYAPHLQAYRDVITFYLENIPHISYFTYVKMLVENDEIILEPIDRTAPILIKGLNNVPNIKFRCPDWYKGYVKAVDCSPYAIRELFKDFQVIFEKTILQPLPR